MENAVLSDRRPRTGADIKASSIAFTSVRTGDIKPSKTVKYGKCLHHSLLCPGLETRWRPPPRANIFFSVAAAAAAAHSLEQERLLRVYHDGDDADISKGQVEWSGYCGLLFVRRDERMRVGPTYI